MACAVAQSLAEVNFKFINYNAERKQLYTEILKVSLRFQSVICTGIVWDVKGNLDNLWGKQYCSSTATVFLKRSTRYCHSSKKED